MVISFFGNRALEGDVRRTAEAISSIRATAVSMASLQDLQHLDAARVQLARLTRYRRAGAPLRLRWGVYSGDSLYEDFRTRYFDRFRKLLFGDTQTQMASFLRNRPTSPTNISDDDYSTAYNTLKAYLMTTLNPDKTDTSFLSQFLLSKWSGPMDSAEQNRLALEQFRFYADELRIDNPFPGQDDALVHQSVEQSRRYLVSFMGADFVYRRYLSKVRQACKCEPLDFSKRYSEAEGLVREPKTIDAPFTKEGWKAMQSLISRNDWSTDDEWVLGPGAKEALTRGVNAGEVKNAYESDYVRTWREYVKAASVVGFGGTADASRKLGKLTGNRSPLLELLCEVSENTAETSPDIAKAFLPVNDVVKAPCYNLVAQGSTKAYMNALSDLKLCIDRYQENPADPATQREVAFNSCKTQQLPVVFAEAAKAVPTVDHEADLDKCVVSLLKLGACSGKTPLPTPPPDRFCLALNRLSSKYPFKADSIEEITMEDFDAFFRPGTGVLSREIASGLGKGGSRANLIRFAQNVQSAVYPNGSSVPQYHFTVSAIVPAGMKTAQLNLDGVLLKVDEAAPKKESFTWPGKTHEAELRVGDSKNLAYGGPWAVFHLLGNYSWSASHGGFYLVSAPLNGPQGSTFRDTLELKAEGIPLFRRGYLSQLRCGRSENSKKPRQ